jgi:hypothetical protein
MAGFLDPNAPNVGVEYRRYLDSDVLGKIIFKNFAINIAGCSELDVEVPIGRFGDARDAGKFLTDVPVRISKRWRQVEVKYARINIPNRHRGSRNENWAFSRLLKTADGSRKSYDVAFIVAARERGLEDPNYWRYEQVCEEQYRKSERDFDSNAMPHERPFLSRCGFLVIPRRDLEDNNFRVSHTTIGIEKYRDYFSWGSKPQDCRRVWKRAMA